MSCGWGWENCKHPWGSGDPQADGWPDRFGFRPIPATKSSRESIVACAGCLCRGLGMGLEPQSRPEHSPAGVTVTPPPGLAAG